MRCTAFEIWFSSCSLKQNIVRYTVYGLKHSYRRDATLLCGSSSYNVSGNNIQLYRESKYEYKIGEPGNINKVTEDKKRGSEKC